MEALDKKPFEFSIVQELIRVANTGATVNSAALTYAITLHEWHHVSQKDVTHMVMGFL